MKNDIRSRADIEQVIHHFYTKVRNDDLLNVFFTEIVPVNWEKHLPVMVDFWENTIFYTGNYEGNPMRKHAQIHQKKKLEVQHYQRWLSLWRETIDDEFSGEKAEMMKSRGEGIATIMQQKIKD